MKRSMVQVLAALVCLVAAAGCSRSLEGSYLQVCKASCTASDDCENITKVAVDLDKCNRDCENNADNYASQVEDKCGADYEILGDKVDRCTTSIEELGQVCRDDHKSDYNAAATHVFDDCSEDAVRCK